MLVKSSSAAVILLYFSNLSVCLAISPAGWGGGGVVLQISSDGDDPKIAF